MERIAEALSIKANSLLRLLPLLDFLCLCSHALCVLTGSFSCVSATDFSFTFRSLGKWRFCVWPVLGIMLLGSQQH